MRKGNARRVKTGIEFSSTRGRVKTHLTQKQNKKKTKQNNTKKELPSLWPRLRPSPAHRPVVPGQPWRPPVAGSPGRTCARPPPPPLATAGLEESSGQNGLLFRERETFVVGKFSNLGGFPNVRRGASWGPKAGGFHQSGLSAQVPAQPLGCHPQPARRPSACSRLQTPEGEEKGCPLSRGPGPSGGGCSRYPQGHSPCRRGQEAKKASGLRLGNSAFLSSGEGAPPPPSPAVPTLQG